MFDFVSILGVNPDADSAEAYLRAAANANYAKAQAQLGDLYFNQNTRNGFSKALEWYQKAAQQNDGQGQYGLAYMYFYGQGVAKDIPTAWGWYQKAAANGYSEAMLQLGYLYDTGIGTKADAKIAADWYQKAIAAGNVTAIYNLALMYLEGEGVKKDQAKAMRLLEEGAEASSADAELELGYLYQTGKGPVKQDYTQAINWYKKAAEEGNLTAMYNLGNVYLFSDGVQDYDQGKTYTEKAAAGNNPDAIYQMGIIYRDGLGVKMDPVAAYAWFATSARAGIPEGSKSRDEVAKSFNPAQKEAAEALTKTYMTEHTIQ